MIKKSIVISAVVCLLCFFLVKILLAVPYNGRLSISPTGTYCVNEISKVNGYWMTVSGDWTAQTAILSYQNIKDAADNNSVTVSGSSGTTSISIGNKVGHYNLSLTVIYTYCDKSVTVHEVGELCIVDIFSVSGGGETICKGSALNFHAEAAPTTCEFPSGHPKWEIGKKGVSGQFENWASKDSGADISVTFNQVGVFKLRARCGASNNWVESLEVKVPSDGTITTEPNIICADYAGKITLKATLDDTSAFHEDFDSYPIWEKNDNPTNPNAWVALPQLTGKLIYPLQFSNLDGSTGEMKIRAKFCDSYEWKETTIKIVDIAKVTLDKSLVCVNEAVNVKAIPTSGDVLQESEVRWMMIYKEKYADAFNDADWKATNYNGNQSFSHAFNKAGVYKFRAKCCVPGEWIESGQICVFDKKDPNLVTSFTLKETIVPPTGNNYGLTKIFPEGTEIDLKPYLDCNTKTWKIGVSKAISNYEIFYRIFPNQIEASADLATDKNCSKIIGDLLKLGIPARSTTYYSTEAVKAHEMVHVSDWQNILNEKLNSFANEYLSTLTLPVECGDNPAEIKKRFYDTFMLDEEIKKVYKKAAASWKRLDDPSLETNNAENAVNKIIIDAIKAKGFPNCQ